MVGIVSHIVLLKIVIQLVVVQLMYPKEIMKQWLFDKITLMLSNSESGLKEKHGYKFHYGYLYYGC